MHFIINLLEEDRDMNIPYLDSKMAMFSAVGTTAVIMPSTEPVTGRIADRDQMVESGQRTIQETSHQEPATAAGRARSWCQRLLAVAAHNPPHLL
jgi:hypothetical protein